jgi:PQQ-dependent catabolism-associated CXXCW motif protein
MMAGGPGSRCRRLALAAVAVATLLGAPVAAEDGAVAVNAAKPAAEPDDYRMNDYRSPVPATLKGAEVVTVAAAKALHDQGGSVFVDVYPRAPKPDNLPAGTVWRDPIHETLPGATWLPNTGYGVLSPQAQGYLEKGLAALTGGDRTKPLVFFCLRDCWMSWNAAKRAMTLGYTHIVWFPEGVDGWKEADLPIATALPWQ